MTQDKNPYPPPDDGNDQPKGRSGITFIKDVTGSAVFSHSSIHNSNISTNVGNNSFRKDLRTIWSHIQSEEASDLRKEFIELAKALDDDKAKPSRVRDAWRKLKENAPSLYYLKELSEPFLTLVKDV